MQMKPTLKERNKQLMLNAFGTLFNPRDLSIGETDVIDQHRE
jgi:hypothetical protein